MHPPSSFFPGLLVVGFLLLVGAWMSKTGLPTEPGARLSLTYDGHPASAPVELPNEASDSARTTVVLRVAPLPVPVLLPVAPKPATPPPYPLVVPVVGIAAGDLVDSFGDFREDSTRTHRALDILAPTGTPVVAAAAGRIARLHTSTRGGLTVYQSGPSGRYIYYYAHLNTYADSLHAGQSVAAGDTLGTVGATGNADAAVPHLHFAIWRQRRGSTGWGGTPVNPFEALTR